MQIIIGSARSDERKKYSGGAKGDQRQSSAPDYVGEVSMQTFYVHSKGWYVLRAKSAGVALGIAAAMKRACNNINIGYSQSDRYGVIRYGTNATQKCNADCSSLVRQCVREAAGKDPGDFTTANAVSVLLATGLFDLISYTPGMVLYEGDILCTKTKGHIVAVTDGEKRHTVGVAHPHITDNNGYYPAYTGKSKSLVEALKSIGIDSSKEYRKKIAEANGINNYFGMAPQNSKLLGLLKNGKLKKI